MGRVGKGNSKPFVVRLPNEQREVLEEIANREDRSVSATIRRAIDEYASKRKVQLPVQGRS